MDVYSNFRYCNLYGKTHDNCETLDIKRVVTKR